MKEKMFGASFSFEQDRDRAEHAEHNSIWLY